MAFSVNKSEDSNNSSQISILKCSYFCIFGAQTCVYTLIPVFLKSIGQNESQIGILCALQPLISFWMSPSWSALADRYQLHTIILFSSLLISAAIRYFYMITPSFYGLAVVLSLASVFDAPVQPIVDTFSMKQLTDASEWGKMRLWGAAGFGLCSFLAGFIVSETNFGWSGIFVMYWVLMALTFLLLGLVYFKRSNMIYLSVHDEPDQISPEIGSSTDRCVEKENQKQQAPSVHVDAETQNEKKGHSDEQQAPSGHISAETQNADKGHSDEQETKYLIQIFSNQENLLFLLIIFVGGFSVGVIETFLYVHLKKLGARETLMGLGQAIACTAEIPFFHFAPNLIKRFGEQNILRTALLVYVIRLGYYSLLGHLPLWAVLPAEILHGFTFAALWAASTSYGYKIAPPHLKTTMQGLINGIHWGVGSGFGALIGGVVFHRFGAVVLFRSTAAVVAFVLFCSMLQRWCTKTAGLTSAAGNV